MFIKDMTFFPAVIRINDGGKQMEFKGKVITGQKAISALLNPEVYIKGKQSGLRWAYLIELGLQARDTNFERNRLMEQSERQARALDRLQRELNTANDELDRLKAEKA